MNKIFNLILFFSISIFGQSEQNNKPKISVIGSATVNAFPNACQITIAFNHLKPALRDAINENQKTTSEVLKIVKKYVSDTLEIKTSLISTNKSTRWDDRLNKDVFLGFTSSQRLIFTLKDIKKIQDFTEELLITKFNKIEKISYFNTEAQDYIKQAQELAVVDAVETTKRLAKAGDLKAGNIIYIQSNKSPNDNTGNRLDTYQFESYGKGMGGKGVSSSGELINYTVSVTLHTEIIE
jgi:uncharacterized protein YggE